MRRAQLLTADFILSIAIFISILLTLITVWGTVDTQIKDVENRRDLQSLSIAVSDSLVRSPGNPEDWNATSVQSIGLATTERVLSFRHILDFFSMNYRDAKSRIRLANYEVQIKFLDKDGNNLTSGAARSPIAYYARDPAKARLLEKLNNTGVVWDLYWGNAPANLPANQNTYTRRYFYSDAQPQIPLNQTIENSSAYRTIIIENADVNGFGMANSDFNISGLAEFVSKGGILIVIGQGAPGANLIDENFSVHGNYAFAGQGNGNITDPWYLLPLNLSGRGVFFTENRWYLYSSQYDAPLNIIVSREDHPDQCMVCYWEYGFGRVYYAEDLGGSVQAGPQVADALALVGNKLIFGLSPALPSQVVTVRRIVLIEGFDREPAILDMRVWK